MTWGGGGSKEKMTKCDMGGGGLKNGPFWSDILFAWPLRDRSVFMGKRADDMCGHQQICCDAVELEM